MPTVNSQNFTTLYSATAQEIVPAEPYGNANVEAFLNIGTDGGNTVQNILANGEIVANGNITTNDFFVGDGGFLSNITAYSNIIANVANFANFAGNVTNSAQPNITSVGTLLNLSVTGNIDSVSGIFNGDGSGLSNINVSNITGNANFANFAGNVTNSAQPNITSVGTLVTLNVSGNANVGGVNNAATQFNFIPEGKAIGLGAGGNISTLVVTDLGLNNSNANPGILTFIKGRGTVASPLPASNNDITFRLNSGVITSTSNLATGANIPTAAQIQVTAISAANATFSSTSWTPGAIRIRTGNPAGNIANANSSSNFNTLVFNQTGAFNMFQGASGPAGFNFFTYSPATFAFQLAGGNAEANSAILANQQLGAINFQGATSTPAPGGNPQINTGAQIFANSAPSAVISAGQNFATNMFVSTRGGNLNLLANTATPDSSNQSINMATIGTGQVYISSNTVNVTGNVIANILLQSNANLSVGTANTLQFQDITTPIPGTSQNVMLLKTASNLRFDSGVYYNNWDWNIDNIITEEKYYANDINTGNKVYFGKTSMLGYGSPGTQATPSVYAINVFETTSDLSNANTATGSFMQVGQGGFLAVVGSQINAPIFGLFNYGNTTQSQASAIRINRRRGNGDARTNVVASDYLGNIEWRGSGSATGSLNSKIVTFGAKVDSSYGGPGNVMPIGFEMDVVDSSNNFIAHSFYANGNVNLNGNVAMGNLATANYFQGDGSLLTNINSQAIAANYLDSNYTATIGAITANTIYGIPLTSLSATNITIATGTIAIDNATATGPTRITFGKTGRYNLQFSIQLENTDNAADHLFDIWLRKNGADVAETNTQYTVVKNNGKNVAALNLLLNPTAVNDYYELVYAVSDAAVGIKTIAAQTTPFVRPLTPGIIVTVVPVGA